jgi:hypothetical protein
MNARTVPSDRRGIPPSHPASGGEGANAAKAARDREPFQRGSSAPKGERPVITPAPIRCLATLVLLGATAGCALQYEIRVNAYTARPPTSVPSSGEKVAIYQDPRADNPLLEQEVARKIERLMAQRGFQIVPMEDASYAIAFKYGIGQAPNRTGALPVYQPGATTTVNTIGAAGIATSTVQLPGTTTYIPFSVSQHARSLSVRMVDARKLKDTTEAPVIWAADTASSGSNSDIREVMNYLLVATFQHFGEDTGKAVVQILSDDDKRALALGAE